jgi:8-oxo-dGTP diphosphatase
MITNYVVAFLFTHNVEKVWLIQKQKPEWQKGCLNGIGGKIEEDETPMQAVIRELKEESGLDISAEQLIEVGEMKGINNDSTGFNVTIFTGTTDKTLRTMEVEKIDLYQTNRVKLVKHIGNVPMLIETCLYRLRHSSNFHYITMHY